MPEVGNTGERTERPAAAPTIAFDALATTAASLELNGVPCVRGIIVQSESALEGAAVRLRVEGADHAPWQSSVERLPAGGAIEIDAAGFVIPPAILRRSNEREWLDLVATLVGGDGQELASERHRVAVLPSSHWAGTRLHAPSLAAFVTPNAAPLAELLREASRLLRERTGSGALDGYLSGSPERAQRIAEACYDALATRGVGYILAQPSFEAEGQKVRIASEVLADGLGNCLDLSTILAAMLEACGLAPVLALGDGHAVVGFATIDEHFPDATHEGPSRLRNRLDLGELRMLESTAACERRGFGEALATGERWLAGASESIVVVDVRAARRAGYHPLPEILERRDAKPTVPTPDPRGGGEWTVRLPADLKPVRAAALTPEQSRLERWKKKLLDLTLRNRLLNDRSSAGIPLALAGDEAVGLLESALWDEHAMRLVPRGSVRELAADAAREEIGRRWLRSSLEDAELFKRATKACREGVSSLQETGARSLYVAIGFLEHRVDGRSDPVRAPLLLVPVEMKRISRTEGFTVRAVAEDTVANVALVESMRIVHGLDIGLGGELAEDDKGLDVPAILARVRRQVRDVPGATVVAEAKLGIYSFKKLPLFEEMRARGAKLLTHPVVGSLLSRSATKELLAARMRTPAETDDAAPFATMRLPLAADSSQIAAVCSAAEGATFVLQGPPGTGKSQTITNLLSECLARGKRVLFIAEKAAALEVVSERLDRCGLGGFALDLHADHASKSEFVAQVKAALADLETRAAPGARQFPQVGARIDRERARLRAACESLHGRPKGAPDDAPSVYDAAERRIATAAAAQAVRAAGLEGRLDGVLPQVPTGDDIAARLAATRATAAAADGLARGTAEALRDFAPTARLTHEEALLVASDARAALAALESCESADTALATALGAPRPATLGAAARLRAFAASLDLASPGAADLAEAACAPDHASRLDRFAQAVALAAKERDALARIDAAFDRGVLAVAHAAFAGDLRAAREKFIVLRWLVVRRVRGELARHARTTLPKDLDALLALVESVTAADAATKAVQPYARELSILGDPDSAARAIEAARATARAVRVAFPAEHATMGLVVAAAIRSGSLGERIARATAAARALDEALSPVTRAASPVGPLAADDATVAALRERLARLAERAADLPAWSTATVAREDARRVGLLPFADALLSGALPTAIAEEACETEMLAGWVRRRMREDAALADCCADRLAPLRKVFADAMDEYRRGAGAAVAATARDRANESVVREDAPMRDALRVLDGIRAQTTIRRPIRRVMQESAAAITAIKPIVLASPLSAATMLPPDFPAFDLVVFDEASQVPVWDAACAISRAKGCVIVGDSRQLPPTSFFDRREAGSEGPANADAELAEALEPLDSLLDEAIASGIPEKSLLWHYRSRDERLIEFSNRRSYEGRLQTFPAARRANANLGVEFRHVAGVYDRGGKSTNAVEAKAVVEEIRRRLLDDDACPANRSIGVVTFSEAQQTLVQDLLDEAVDGDERLRERMAEAAKLGDEVFVKNLENVQGDERATMIFSICYGRDASGSVYHNFGPLNLSGGERRLNVAVTRAREKVVVISSIRASDLDPARCTSKGARDLRDYLAYAELGTVPATRGASAGGHEVDPSPAERALASAIEARGWKVDLHVGRSRDYRVGLALAAPDDPARWILGVELDGAFHRAAPTVVDRELVRGGVLKGLGWRTMRVSCLDVLRDLDAVVARIDADAREATAR